MVFLDRETCELKASYHYQREIKSGFIYLNDQSDSEQEDDDVSSSHREQEEPSEKMQLDQTGSTSDPPSRATAHYSSGHASSAGEPSRRRDKRLVSPVSGVLSIVQHGLQ
jgi:hypothetical protein